MLTPNDPIYKGVVGVASNILAANKSESPMIQSAQWKVTVVDDLTVSNAFVLPVSNSESHFKIRLSIQIYVIM